MSYTIPSLTGFTKYANNRFVVRKNTGLIRTFQENLIVYVLDETGAFAKNVQIGLIRNGEPEIILTLTEGQYFEKVVISTTYEFRIIEDDNYIPLDNIEPFSHDGFNTKSVKIKARRKYYYAINALRSGVRSNSVVVQLENS